MNSGNTFRSGSISRPHRAGIPEEIHVRQPDDVEVESIETVPAKYIALALVHLRNQIANLAKMAEDHSRPFDEYTPQVLTPESMTNVTVQPGWEVPEIVQSIVVTGPTGTPAFTLQLGDRFWNLTLPAEGILVISPVSIMLSRSDNRVLTPSAPGEWSLELMGYCDDRAG